MPITIYLHLQPFKVEHSKQAVTYVTGCAWTTQYCQANRHSCKKDQMPWLLLQGKQNGRDHRSTQCMYSVASSIYSRFQVKEHDIDMKGKIGLLLKPTLGVLESIISPFHTPLPRFPTLALYCFGNKTLISNTKTPGTH